MEECYMHSYQLFYVPTCLPLPSGCRQTTNGLAPTIPRTQDLLVIQKSPPPQNCYPPPAETLSAPAVQIATTPLQSNVGAWGVGAQSSVMVCPHGQTRVAGTRPIMQLVGPCEQTRALSCLSPSWVLPPLQISPVLSLYSHLDFIMEVHRLDGCSDYSL